VAWPLFDQLNPDAFVKAVSTMKVDISSIEPGSFLKVAWRGKPIYIRRRTSEEIAEAEKDDNVSLPDPEKDVDRVLKKEWLVVVGVCTHLGCIPIANQGEYEGWFCPCHGSHYDISGRIRKGPAPTNLEVPPYEFVSDSLIKIG
jgi:ubiquinol-cytochrome c reductase, iron-sulfur subunit